MFKHLLGFFLLIPSFIVAQTGGENSFLVVNTTASAHQIALGGKTLTLLNNVNQPNWNPATINVDMDRKLSANYSSYLSGISVGSLSYVHQFNRYSAPIYFGIQYNNYGTLISADTEGNETGTFSASDIVINSGYAYKIPNSNFTVGANAKFINSTIANFNATALAFDFGVLYNNSYKPYIFSIVIRNAGFQLSKFINQKEKLPFEIALGASYQLENMPLKWYVTLDNLQKWKVAAPNPSNSSTDLEGNTTDEEISFLDNAFRHVIIGAELFPKKAINLRVGYNFRRSKELQLQNTRSFGGLSFGFGLKMNKIKLNYAYAKFHSAANTSTFSLEIDLSRNPRGSIPTRY
ncbi:type IX secretion system protein PorQ [Tenacibaculum geojense]|uniref:Type IX secretion system protein PorQ n=1 Tax=Tenacibaculum geojense TaxID=915352 RepID=A0ABW3JVH1_9FLAO